MRVVYHQTRHRVQAHIFVAALPHLLHRAIENHLQKAGIDLSATAALTTLKSLSVVDIDLGNKPPSVPSLVAHSAPQPYFAPSASSTSSRQPRQSRARPSCSPVVTNRDATANEINSFRVAEGNMG